MEYMNKSGYFTIGLSVYLSVSDTRDSVKFCDVFMPQTDTQTNKQTARCVCVCPCFSYIRPAVSTHAACNYRRRQPEVNMAARSAVVSHFRFPRSQSSAHSY